MVIKNLNKKLQLTIEQLDTVFDLIPVSICITTIEDGVFIYVNNYFEKLFACKRKNILNQKSTDLKMMSIENRTQLTKKVFDKGRMKNVKTEITTLDSKKINVIISVEKIFIDNKQYYITTTTDITEKIKSSNEIRILNKELAYQQSEKQNREDELGIAIKELSFQDKEKLKHSEELRVKSNQLVEAQILGQIGSWDWDFVSDAIFWTDEMYRIYGLKPQKVKINSSNFLMAIHPDDIEHVKTQSNNSILSFKPFQCFFRIIRPDKTIREINAVGKVYTNSKNEIIRMAGIAQDITEKNQAQKQLYSRSLIEASRDPMVTLNTKGEIMDMNEAMLLVTDKTREQLINTAFCLYFTDKEKAENVYSKVFKHGFVKDYPLTMLDGKLTEVLFNGSVYKDESGKVIGAVIVARDVSEQKKLERNLVEYKHLFNENLDFACIANASGFFEVVNKSFENVLGYSEHELLNTSFLNFVHPDDTYRTLKEIKNLREGNRTGSFINKYIKKDGTFLLLDWKANYNKIVNKIYATARDITEQKKIEQNLINSLKEVTDYKLALDASTIVDITDKNGNIVFVNDNYLKISNYSYEELIGGNHKIVNSTFHSKDFMSKLWSTISKGKIWKNDIRNKDKNGNYYWLSMTIVPFNDEFGIPYQYVAISIDITAQKNLELELTEAKIFAEMATSIAEESRQSAEDATKSKQQFLSNMSHEIRTPMNAIIGFTKVMLKTELTAKQKEYLMAIKISGDALIVLINDILDLAKVDSGKMTFEKRPFKLSLSISSMLHLFETKIQEKNLELITNYDKTIPEVLLGDPVRLNQIILNLVSNAIKFTNKGIISISVNLLSQNTDKVSIKFSVQDTGIGIKQTKIEKIFENFQQENNTTSRLYGGTGLGLAIVKQLVEAQGGTIEIESKINKGSTFSFVLDFKKTTAHVVHETEILEFDSSIKNTKVLVVEDMELNQLLMRTLLDDFGFECDITANGKLAIEKLQTKTYDIILMDLQMPEMNGYEATEYIRKKLKLQIPIIALTADVTAIDIEACKAAGMNDYIAKPVDEHLLYNKLIALTKNPLLIKEDTKGENPTKYITKCVDMTYMKKLTKADPKLISQLINAYLKQTPPLVQSMKKSLINKDMKMLKCAVHKMIPSFSIIGLNPSIHEMAIRIQKHTFSIENTAEIHNLVIELEKVCVQSCEELEIELDNLNK
jgi:PAS domain S-box-containing protein